MIEERGPLAAGVEQAHLSEVARSVGGRIVEPSSAGPAAPAARPRGRRAGLAALLARDDAPRRLATESSSADGWGTGTCEYGPVGARIDVWVVGGPASAGRWARGPTRPVERSDPFGGPLPHSLGARPAGGQLGPSIDPLHHARRPSSEVEGREVRHSVAPMFQCTYHAGGPTNRAIVRSCQKPPPRGHSRTPARSPFGLNGRNPTSEVGTRFATVDHQEVSHDGNHDSLPR